MNKSLDTGKIGMGRVATLPIVSVDDKTEIRYLNALELHKTELEERVTVFGIGPSAMRMNTVHIGLACKLATRV